MGSCTAKPANKNKNSSDKYKDKAQQPTNQVPITTAQIISPLSNKEQEDNNEITSAHFPKQQQQHQEVLKGIEEPNNGQQITQVQESNKNEKPQNNTDNQEDEEEKMDYVKHKNTIFSMDQQSTQFTSALNELTSKKDYQTSETSTNNPMRQKKPTKVNTYDQGFVVQIFEPTQNSMEEAFSINEVDEEVEEDSQENLTDENEENIAQKNQHFQKIYNDNSQFKLFNVVSQRNPNDIASQLSVSRLSHSGIQNEHNE